MIFDTIVKTYGDGAIKHNDDIFIKNADGNIKHIDEVEDRTDVNKAVKEMEATGYKLPCVVTAVAQNQLDSLFAFFVPKVSASGSCVKKISCGVYEIEGKGIKATADEASNISLHLNNGKKFDVDEFKNLKNNVSGGNIDGYINFKAREDIVTKNQGIIARMFSQYKGNWYYE